jgi:hypothetical protein
MAALSAGQDVTLVGIGSLDGASANHLISTGGVTACGFGLWARDMHVFCLLTWIYRAGKEEICGTQKHRSIALINLLIDLPRSSQVPPSSRPCLWELGVFEVPVFVFPLRSRANQGGKLYPCSSAPPPLSPWPRLPPSIKGQTGDKLW